MFISLVPQNYQLGLKIKKILNKISYTQQNT